MLAWLMVACGAPASPPPPPEPAVEAPAPAPVPEPAPEPDPAPPPDELADQRAPPEGWVDLRVALPDARFDVRYHTADNFTGAPLPGYGVPGAWMLEAPATALVAVQATLQEQGLTLMIHDAYRPLRGTLAMVAWAERTDQAFLLDNGYIARRSGHNKGNTVDLSLADATTGVELDMGTEWDTLSEASHTRAATGEPLARRLLLKDAMEAQGFEAYWKEWWHFGYPPERLGPEHPPLKHHDVPYACWEPDVFVAPEGWNTPGFVMPATFTPAPCAP